MKRPILCAGRLYCDLIFADTPRMPTAGTEVFAAGLSLHGGGGAFITGATLAALGHPVSQFSVLPAAPFDKVVSDAMARYGVSAGLCQPADKNSDPQVTVAITGAGDRAFLTRADGPAIPDTDAIDFGSLGHLHISELRTLQDHPELLDQAKAANITISLDCGWQDSFDPDVGRLIADVDVFLPNEVEAEALTNVGISPTCAALTVVKCGANGARARHRDADDWVQISTTPVPVLDATGAGDAFNGGFLSRWLDQAPLDVCIANGNTCGAAAVQAIGGASGVRELVRRRPLSRAGS